MTDRSLLKTLEGQQNVVLRPSGDVARLFEAAQAAHRAHLPHPRTGHVTLRGVAEPARIDDLRRMLHLWAAEQPPIEVSVDGIDGFPPPFQVLIVRLARTPTLVQAYAALSRAAPGFPLEPRRNRAVARSACIQHEGRGSVRLGSP